MFHSERVMRGVAAVEQAISCGLRVFTYLCFSLFLSKAEGNVFVALS